METHFQRAMEPLSFLIGVWNTEGKIRKDDNNPEIIFNGTDSYEWVLNRRFIMHKADVTMGIEKIEVIEFIGEFDEKNNRYKMRSFDNLGVFTEMEAYIGADSTLNIIGNKMRSKLSVQDANNMAAHWERSEDNQNWFPWMDLRLSKRVKDIPTKAL